MQLTAPYLTRVRDGVPSVPTNTDRLRAWHNRRPRAESDGPERDPLDVAAEAAARRLADGLSLDTYDWEALKAKATSELLDLDYRQF